MRKIKASHYILFAVILIGICLLLYPTLSNSWNSYHQSKAIASYDKSIKDMSEKDHKEVVEKAQQYNEQIAHLKTTDFHNGEPIDKTYKSLLNINNDSIMGYIEIDSINVKLPIYHGTSESVLSVAVGHLEGSSLPIGGKNTHSVLTGHRGLTGAKLFTDLDRLKNGDTFKINTLGKVLTYEVENVSTVEPYQINKLNVAQDKDLCTLVTCTPYGVNSHRLLVTGHRVENVKVEQNEKNDVSTKNIQTNTIIYIPIIIAPILLVLAIWLLFFKPNKKKKHTKNNKEEVM